MSRLALTQMVLFVVVTVACGYFVATGALGPHTFRDPVKITVRMPTTGGLSVGSQVTYRGVEAGEVSDLRISDDSSGVVATAALDPEVRIPSNSTVVVAMDSPLAILHLDFQPDEETEPYLTEGDVVTAEQTQQPLPLDTLLDDFMQLSDSLPTEDIAAVGQALATGLDHPSGDLTRIIDNTRELLDRTQERMPQLENILENSERLAAQQGERIRALTATMKDLSSSLRDHEPELWEVFHEIPESTRRVTELVQENEHEFATLLGNLVTTSQLVGVRAPAVEKLAQSVPNSLHALGSIVEGDTAQFYLVGTQGPVCYHDTDRRTPQQTEPRTPEVDYDCPPDTNLAQRGAKNAPRPESGLSDPEPPSKPPSNPTGQDVATGEDLPFRLGSNGGQTEVLGPRSWSSLLLQGVS